MRSLLIPRRPQSGVVLLVVLGIVLTLSLIGYSMALSVRVNARVADNAVRKAQARWLANAAVENSLALVLSDETIEDGVEETWQNRSAFEPAALGTGKFSVEIPDPGSTDGVAFALDDESAKLNINTATREQLLEIPGMTEDLADPLIDWRDADSIPGLYGAESDFYLGLDDPYEARNANYSSIRELLLVRGFDEAILYGEDANGNGELDANEDDGDDSPPHDNKNGILDPGLEKYLTVYSADRNIANDGTARVNIQNASAEDLVKKLSGLTQQEADAVVQYRGNNQLASVIDLINVTAQQENQDQAGGGGGRGDRGGRGEGDRRGGRDGRGRGDRRDPSLLGGGGGRGGEGGGRGGDGGGGGGGDGRDGGSDQGGGGGGGGGRGGGGFPGGGGRGGGGRGGGEGGGRFSGNRFSSGGGFTGTRGGESGDQGGDNASSSGQGQAQKLFDLQRIRPWLDLMTVKTEQVIPGLVNVNTAPEEVLRALGGFSDEDISQILLKREAGGVPFKTVGDLLDLPGMDDTRMRQVIEKVTTRSFEFTVHGVGALDAGRATQRIEAVIERDENGARVLHWRES